MMDRNELLRALRRLKVETGSFVCFGCGLEHDCSTRGCAILRVAISALELDAAQLSASEVARTELAQALARAQQELQDQKVLVEDMQNDVRKLIDSCDICAHDNVGINGECDCECEGCEDACICGSCKGGSNFVYRRAAGGE